MNKAEMDYLAECNKDGLQDYFVRKLESVDRRAKVIRAEQQMMIEELADAEIVRRLLQEPEAIRKLLARRKRDAVKPSPDGSGLLLTPTRKHERTREPLSTRESQPPITARTRLCNFASSPIMPSAAAGRSPGNTSMWGSREPKIGAPSSIA
jgi:hypothetical protein